MACVFNSSTAAARIASASAIPARRSSSRFRPRRAAASQSAEASRRRKPLNGGDLVSTGLEDHHETGIHWLAIQ